MKGLSLDTSISSLATPGTPTSPPLNISDQPKWRSPENFKEIEDELLKKNVQVGDLSSQVITLKEDLLKKEQLIAELKQYILELKPNPPLPSEILSSQQTENSGMSVEHHTPSEEANIQPHPILQVDPYKYNML